MAGFGFRDERFAKRLKQIASVPGALKGSEGLLYSDAWFVKSPVGGIPAMSGSTLGSAVCDCYQLSYDEGTGVATMELMTDSDGATITIEVHHAGQSNILSNRYLIVAFMYGVYVPIVEYC